MGQHCMAESPGATIPSPLAPRPGELVIRKRESSGFCNPELVEALRREGVEEVYLAGDLCVYPNAKDLIARRFKPKAIDGAIAAPYRLERLRAEFQVFEVPLVALQHLEKE